MKTKSYITLTRNIYTFLLLAFVLIPCNSECQWIQPGGSFHPRVLSVSGPYLFAARDDSGIERSSDYGATWTSVNTGLTNYRVTDIDVSGINIFASTWGGGVFLSTNSGNNWSPVNSGLSYSRIRNIAVSGTNVYLTTSLESIGGQLVAGIYFTSNNGTSWNQINSDIPNVGDIYGLSAIGTNIFVSLSLAGVYRSTNNGANWIWANSGITDPTAYNFHVLGTKIFVGSQQRGVFMSTDFGGSWAQAGMDNTYILCFANSGSNLFAGTSFNGVHYTSNFGSSWSSVNTGLLDNRIFCLAVQDTFLFAGAQTTGLWRRPLSEMTVSVNILSTQTPDNFSLSQNYPNPFNPTTNINFDIQKSGQVKIVVYDINGREISTLVNEELNPGSYKADFDGISLSSGIYYYTMTSGEFVETRKMMLVK